ncbi:peptide/nickel transport system substrate-binding protein [Nitratiruptor sp. YY08-26]|uniref:peptide-binding protein n=1 Tax=unclassified Nitratiruptor TaxID=2624044 RepID=UPI001915BD5A|nr:MULTISPECIES: peptide-binding protein [unclassified Nitratiruptor]BCD62929.1 peptide/nickel transport system substrate-binding protein [Nitratiruptor sp. YY08-13]BCD66864.1 peptide/nickel transport system substrate-binding protein [Nitratiruptor sp. YY08-26]
MRKAVFLLFFSFSLLASTLHLSIGASPSRINPLLATDSASAEIAGWIFNGLFKYDKDGKIVGDLAQEWRFLDKKTLWIALRKGVKWHDGKPFSAQDVLFTYKLAISPKIFTPYASEFRYVENVEVIDDLHLIVHYKKPYFKALQTWMMGILPKHILQNEKDLMTSSFNQHPIGTGPYKLQGFEVSKDIVLKANSDYFEHAPHIEKIVYHFLPDPSTQFLMLKSKKLDVGALSPLQLERQIDEAFRSYYAIYEQPSHSYTYLGFNLKNKKFQDKRVREAINLAIDREEMINILFFSHARVCTGPFMPGTFAFDPDVKAPKPNRIRAKQLLAEAGYNAKHPLEFEIATNSNNSLRMYAAQIIQYQLAKIGVKVTIRAMEWQAFLNTIVTPRKFETILLGWALGLTPDAYSIWHSKEAKLGGFNLISYKNEEVDRLIKEAEITINLQKLSQIYKKIFRLIVADIPYIFLYIPNSITVVNKKIQNIEPSLIGIMHNEIDWIKP